MYLSVPLHFNALLLVGLQIDSNYKRDSNAIQQPLFDRTVDSLESLVTSAEPSTAASMIRMLLDLSVSILI